MTRGGCRCLVRATLALVVAGGGCASQRYRAAVEQNTEAAYLRFMARHPEGELAEDAARRLERLRYWEARRVDRPFGYSQHLQRYPHGTYSAECRRRLAQLALRRARTPAALELILERYPDTEEAGQAERRLPSLLAREILESQDPAPAARFLRRYPQSDQAPAVRSHLAAVRLGRLPGREAELEAFVDEFAGTEAARRALERLERLLASTVRESRDSDDLERFRVRFPRSGQLASLQQLVREERLARSMALLDLKALEVLADEDADARWLLERCRRQTAVCARLRELAARAAPWQPSRPWDQLRRDAYAADPLDAWVAMAQLAWVRRIAAGDLLLELVGSERLSTVWAADRELRLWLENLDSTTRKQWEHSRLARAHRPQNPDEVQRRAVLELVTGKSADGLTALRALTGGQSRLLPSAYLLARWEQRQAPGRAAARSTLVRFASAARARLQWLKDAFPAELHQDSLFSAILVERELFALQQATREVKRAAGGAPAASLEETLREAEGLLVEWRRRLASRQETGHTPSSAPSVREAVEQHERGRGEALRALVRHGRIGRLVARALCRRPAVAPPGCGTLSR